MYTEANLTTFRLVQDNKGLPSSKIPGFSEHETATAMDSLLALYHALKLHHHGRTDCNWVGVERVHRILSKVRFLLLTWDLNSYLYSRFSSSTSFIEMIVFILFTQ